MDNPPQTAEQTKNTRQSDADITKATRDSDAEILATGQHSTINLIWERTQQGIAILCVAASVFSSVYLIFKGTEPLAERGYQFLTNVGLLVIGFYFGRTNHTRPTGENR